MAYPSEDDPFGLTPWRPNLLDLAMARPPQSDPPAWPALGPWAGKPNLLDLAMAASPPTPDGNGDATDSPFGLPSSQSGDGVLGDAADGSDSPAQGPQPSEGTGQPKLPKLTGADDGSLSPQSNSIMSPPPPTAEDWRRYDAEYTAWVDQNRAILERNKLLKEQGYPPLAVPPPPLAVPPPPHRPGERDPNVLYLLGLAAADPFPGHTISPDGAQAHQTWAETLPRDSDPAKTAGFLKNVIAWNGDQGRGDVADLLGRFHQIDPEKATTLQDELHRQSDERIPFRVAPLGTGVQDPAEADPALTLPKLPFGSSDGADHWAAGNMADVLLGKGDYADAVTHYLVQAKADLAGTRAELAAVTDKMAATDPTRPRRRSSSRR